VVTSQHSPSICADIFVSEDALDLHRSYPFSEVFADNQPRNLYTIIETHRDATDKEVYEAFMRMSARLDRRKCTHEPTGQHCKLEMALVGQVLTNPYLRRRYDRFLARQVFGLFRGQGMSQA
jgi:DnaJ-class molecular chaperone